MLLLLFTRSEDGMTKPSWPEAHVTHELRADQWSRAPRPSDITRNDEPTLFPVARGASEPQCEAMARRVAAGDEVTR